VRTSALREIGGLGPELAEDHSTTLMFNSGGWRGVHAVNAIAHGDGPETFTHLVVQEFQWSRSLVTILCEYSPRLVGSLPPRLKFQFLFSQFWYPLFSIMMALSLMLPSYALLTGRYFVNVTYIDYFLHILPLSVVMIILAYWWRATGLFRPSLASIISWEGMAFLFARWPWSLLGSVVAVRDWLFGVIAEFRVTPKKSARAEALPFWVLSPYLGISLACAIIAWGVEDPGTAGGFYIFNLMIAAIYVGLVILIVVRHFIENHVPIRANPLDNLLTGGATLASIAIMTGAIYHNGPKGLAAMNVGISAFTLTETRSGFAGAGRAAKPVIYFKPRWHGFGQNRR
jgi:cellulose synthase (UDP-forming)